MFDNCVFELSRFTKSSNAHTIIIITLSGAFSSHLCSTHSGTIKYIYIESISLHGTYISVFCIFIWTTLAYLVVILFSLACISSSSSPSSPCKCQDSRSINTYTTSIYREHFFSCIIIQIVFICTVSVCVGTNFGVPLAPSHGCSALISVAAAQQANHTVCRDCYTQHTTSSSATSSSSSSSTSSSSALVVKHEPRFALPLLASFTPLESMELYNYAVLPSTPESIKSRYGSKFSTWKQV
jgi:hypothetical protein